MGADKMLESITLLGSSSGRNAGDAALLSGIMDSVDKACQRPLTYEIPTIRPEYVRRTYKNQVRAVSMLPWCGSLKMLGIPTYRSIMRTDLSLIFDAILFDRSLYNPLFNFMSTLYLLLPLAKKRGKRMAFFNVGTGPVDTPRGREMLRELAEMMDFITVRDQDSLDILVNLGVKNPRMLLTADAALTVAPSDESRIKQIYQDLGLNPEEELLAVNINAYIDTWARPRRPSMGKEKFLQVYAGALNEVVRQLKVPLLLVCTQHHDVAITNELASRIKSREPVRLISNKDYNHYDIKGVLSKVSLLAAMRLHAMILASSELAPVVGIAYQPKCAYYFKTLELERWMMSFADFSEQTLASLILEGWDKKSEIKDTLNRRIPVLQSHAFKAAELVAAMRNGEQLDTAFKAVAG